MTHKIVDSNRDVVRSAMEAFVAQEALSRFGYAPKDVFRTMPEREEPAAAPAVALEPEAEIIFPSEGEMKALTYCSPDNQIESRCSAFRNIREMMFSFYGT